MLHNMCLDNHDDAKDILDLDDLLAWQILPGGHCLSENNKDKRKRNYYANAL